MIGRAGSLGRGAERGAGPEGPVPALARFLGALADPTRLRVLALLSGGELCVCHIHGRLALPQPLVSRHLAYLRRSGLVETRRQGVWVYYRISSGLGERRRALLDAVVEQARGPRSRPRAPSRGPAAA